MYLPSEIAAGVGVFATEIAVVVAVRGRGSVVDMRKSGETKNKPKPKSLILRRQR